MQVDVDKLLFTGGVLFGSRALGVNDSNSDVDLAIHRDVFNTLLISNSSPVTMGNIRNYFKVVPYDGGLLVKANSVTHNKETFISSTNIDLLVLNSQRDLDSIHQAIVDTKQYDLTILCHKPSRIIVYERALVLNGFKHPKWYVNLANKLLPKSIMKLLLKDIHEPYFKAPGRN